MPSPYQLDCCTFPNHAYRYFDNDSADYQFYCMTCGETWTPTAYDAAALHDERVEQREAAQFEHGREYDSAGNCPEW